MTLKQLHELREQVQENILVLTDSYLIDELEGYENFDTRICEVIVNTFNRFEENQITL
tara:strand:+ start:415 stop:588 length:174 start_codon:yes stop_codon:yes gene_type:complete